MKRLKSYIGTALLTLLLAGVAASCTGNFDDINRKEYEVTKEEMDRENYAIGATLRSLQGYVIPTQEHSYQFIECLFAGPYAGYFGETNPKWDNSGKGSIYNPTADWLEAAFSTVIVNVYASYRDLCDRTDDPVALALGKLLRVAIMQRETDMFGPIPYSKVLDPQGNASLTVAYDSQEAVYTQMLKELDEVTAVLKENVSIDPETFRKFDNVYFGHMDKWLRFANSLKLRFALRMAYVNPAEAQRVAEAAVADGVITTNADNAELTVEDNRASIIFNEWPDHRVGADLLCYMNGYNDPRREKMFTKVSWQEGGQTVQGFAGVRIGIQCATDLSAFYSKPIISTTSKYMWMNAAEITLLRAEGALRGWSMGGDARSLYEQGVNLSFEQYGVSDPAYLTDDTRRPQGYTDPKGTYSTTAMSSITVPWQPGDENFEANLERIITQKWIALFPNAVEAWSEYRRTDYPKLMPVVANMSGGVINDAQQKIRRLWYPPTEYNENAAHLQEAIATLGGPDNGNTRLWWDKKPR